MRDIVKCNDGVYRWSYEFSLLKNPTILFLLWKIFGFIILGMWLFFVAIEVFESGIVINKLLENAKYFAYFAIGMMIFVLIGYLIYSIIMGGKYCVLFEMDEKGVKHSQMQKQVKKSQLISAITMLVGAISNNPTAAGAGALSAAKSSMYTSFDRVRSVKSNRRRGVIKLNERFMKNQVYADGEDFDFVLNYIMSRVSAK